MPGAPLVVLLPRTENSELVVALVDGEREISDLQRRNAMRVGARGCAFVTAHARVL